MKTLLFCLLCSLCVPATAAEDNVMKAMQAELDRTSASLKMGDFGRPYFCAYTLVDASATNMGASFGALEYSNRTFVRYAKAEVRVGSPEFDNTGYAGEEYSQRPLFGQGPAGDEPDPLRLTFWRLSDQAYKTALERYSQKKAYMEKKNIAERYGDLAPARPEILLKPEPAAEYFDAEFWKERVTELSGVFREFPGIRSSAVKLTYAPRTVRYVNTEGSAYRVNTAKVEFTAGASVQAADGLKISDELRNEYASLAELPSPEELKRQVKAFATDMSYLVTSSSVEVYLGPVVFEGQAAAEFFNQLLVHGVSYPRAPWVENDEYLKYYLRSGDLASRLGMRVMSPFLSVWDDPLQTSYEGRGLAGAYEIDSEAVKPGRLDLVQKGRLSAVYMSRAPIKQFRSSNGHGRAFYTEYPTGRAGNVFIKSEKTAPPSELRQKLLDIARELDLEYAIVVKKMDFEDDKQPTDMLSSPVLAYKVYVADGREVPLHGAEFTGVSYRALRDIVLTSDNYYVYNYYQPGQHVQRPEFSLASIVAPSVLVQEMELKKTDQKPDRLPYLKHPFFEK